ncbi:MAG TPA: multifunctional oxoglutarate decarboxylase/oxoglutarate dehydrogenase thiamine pyrophosphate-binding subunit/dihydrolipoyllysine-residue succinyltransferase subunit [Gaiellaceae bacterium]|nr:multifunctional oxoglutarate decarboxylase/oxoglutarate dehydrogenase thiamine pyrophosphate-binding subunit/dihydrolipoyllysine-residue succinyltransferase subunit [Gaiellaceae bacterium]
MEPDQFDDLNSGFVQELFVEYLASPEAVDPRWRALFESGAAGLLEGHPLVQRLRELHPEGGPGNGAPAVAPAPAEAPPDGVLLGAVAAAMSLVKAHRTHGHLAARLDPLGREPIGDPALDPDRLEPRLTPELQARIPASVLRLHCPGETLAEALPLLRETYCGTLAYELEHISSHEQRLWLRDAIESGEFRRPLAPEERKALLARLSDVEGFERYLRRAFLGQKQFSIEGLDVMVPMLDDAIELAAEGGARRVVIGMAHRGRLNVLAHTVGRDVESILREFEGERALEAVTADLESGSGDVKYHHGAEGVRETASGEVAVTLASNPSHLEFVDPVAEGETRAAQTDHASREAAHDPAAALAILIHGDAAFPGQGVVAETLNLQELEGYAVGGTLHVIANNQVGFTTDPEEGRSTRYSSDLAKGFDTPIIHANADDPEAAISAIRLAMAYRERFRHDVVVDLVGYRRFGHNEGDEPSYTQPLMYKLIEEHRPVRELYAEALVEAGVVTAEEAGRFLDEVQERMRAAHEALKASFGSPGGGGRRDRRIGRGADVQLETAVPVDVLRELNERLLDVPGGFQVHPKLVKALERRRDALGEQGGIDWAQAEGLAFGSLLAEGTPVRLTGQDTERGTFSHRHIVLHDYVSGATYSPIRHLDDAKASFEVYNSPLSETAALGFEYGYSVACPRALVLWEAQFGDFVNSAQVIVDQFIVSGLSKWAQSSRLTLLLPHGYEGNGPEHSSARLERFMQLAAQENVRIVNPSTAAQYFHLLRRQALHPKARALVVLTPKGLLRLKQATSRLDDLAVGGFRAVIDDPNLDADRKREVSRLVICSGKVYYDVVGHEAHGEAEGVAVARLEQLYPFPVAAYDELLSRYPGVTEVVWTQEEPQNMGAWRAIRHRLEEGLPAEVDLRYVGRPWRASPSEGYPTAHVLEQDRIAREALGAF